MAAASLSERQEYRERITAGHLCCAGGKVAGRKVFEEMPLPARGSRSRCIGSPYHQHGEPLPLLFAMSELRLASNWIGRQLVSVSVEWLCSACVCGNSARLGPLDAAGTI
jgi:hypothetical protein